MEHADVDRTIEAARASLVEHMSELGRRFKAARGKLDVPARIAAHPLAAVGVAFALGALLGRRRARSSSGDGEAPGAGRLALAGLGALAFRIMRDAALREASGAAMRWWDRRGADADAAPESW